MQVAAHLDHRWYKLVEDSIQSLPVHYHSLSFRGVAGVSRDECQERSLRTAAADEARGDLNDVPFRDDAD
jgi:hypothetical protein